MRSIRDRIRFMQWFAPPVFPGDADKTRRASLLNQALVTLITLMPFLVVGNLLGGRMPAVVYVANATMFVACLILRAWMRRGHVEQAGRWLLGLGALAITASLMRLGTVRAPSAAMYMLLIITAGLVTGPAAMIATTLFSSLAIAALIVAANAGLLPRPDLTVGVTQGVAYAAAFVWTGGLIYSAIRSLRAAVSDAERDLAARVRAESDLAQHLEQLEEIVRARTEEISQAKDRLQAESDERARAVEALQASLADVKMLSGIIPICMHCKKIRDDQGYWNRLETFIGNHTSAEFSHGICPDCLGTHYPGA